MEPSSRAPSSIQTVSNQDKVIFNEKNRHCNLAVSLPDIDDENMRAVFRYLEHYNQDIFWSFLSDSFFTLGGILMLIISIWNLDSSSNTFTYEANGLFSVVAPFVYMCNSIVDLLWALHAQKRQKQKHALKNRLSNTSHKEPLLTSDSEALPSRWLQFTKHAAHRRTMLAASTFGISASMAFIAALMNSKILDVISAPVYIVSAVFSITGRRSRPWFTPPALIYPTSSQESQSPPITNISLDPEILEDLGDLLFFVGSLVDAGLTDLALERPILTVLQSLFWLIDACLYMFADIQMALYLQY